jgi:hypothetical protein
VTWLPGLTRSDNARAKTYRITSTSQDDEMRTPASPSERLSSRKLVTLPLCAMATPSGKTMLKGCTSSSLPTPTVG